MQGGEVVAVSAPVIAHRDTSVVSVSNTTTETDILNEAVTPGADGAIRVRLTGSRLYNPTGFGGDTTLRVYVNGTARYVDTLLTPGSDANEAPWSIDLNISWDGTTAYINGTYREGTQGGATTGIGNLASGGYARDFGSAGFTNDPSSPVTLRVSLQHGDADTGIVMGRRLAVIETL
ncbi:MAG: hypothetical protein C4534_01535 [Gaiellales bacterium]|nr:MAG: hypothetical protein C4534_01535 [Gaiellales bacterium]